MRALAVRYVARRGVERAVVVEEAPSPNMPRAKWRYVVREEGPYRSFVTPRWASIFGPVRFKRRGKDWVNTRIGMGMYVETFPTVKLQGVEYTIPVYRGKVVHRAEGSNFVRVMNTDGAEFDSRCIHVNALRRVR